MEQFLELALPLATNKDTAQKKSDRYRKCIKFLRAKQVDLADFEGTERIFARWNERYPVGITDMYKMPWCLIKLVQKAHPECDFITGEMITFYQLLEKDFIALRKQEGNFIPQTIVETDWEKICRIAKNPTPEMVEKVSPMKLIMLKMTLEVLARCMNADIIETAHPTPEEVMEFGYVDDNGIYHIPESLHKIQVQDRLAKEIPLSLELCNEIHAIRQARRDDPDDAEGRMLWGIDWPRTSSANDRTARHKMYSACIKDACEALEFPYKNITHLRCAFAEHNIYKHGWNLWNRRRAAWQNFHTLSTEIDEYKTQATNVNADGTSRLPERDDDGPVPEPTSDDGSDDGSDEVSDEGSHEVSDEVSYEVLDDSSDDGSLTSRSSAFVSERDRPYPPTPTPAPEPAPVSTLADFDRFLNVFIKGKGDGRVNEITCVVSDHLRTYKIV